MELINENLVIYLTEDLKISKEKASRVLKERSLGVPGLSSPSVWRFCSERSISSRVSTENVTEMVIEASSKIMSAF